MNIAIVEDEATDREHLLDCLAMYTDDTQTSISVSTFNNADAFLSDGNPKRYELIFLDIYMGDTTGMELAEKLRQRNINSQIVFVTTSSAFAVASYGVEATYYLLKPYEYKKFISMMQVVMKRIEVPEETISVKIGHGVETIPIATIRYVDYADHYVRIHTSARSIRSHMQFPEIEESLLMNPQFLMCYRNVIINMDKVEKLEGDHFVLEQGIDIPITRNCVRKMRDAYTTYIFSRIKRGRDMTPFKAMCYLVGVGINFFVYIFMITYAFQASLRFSKKKTTFIVCVAFLIGAAFDILIFEVIAPFHKYAIIGEIAINIIFFIGAFVIFKKNIFQIVFGFFIIITIQNNVIVAAQLLRELAPMPIIMQDFPDLNYIIYILMVLAAFFPLIYFLFCKLMRRTMEIGIEAKLWKVLFLLPLVDSVYGTISGYGGVQFIEPSWCSLFSLCLLNLFGFATYLIAMKMILYSYDRYEVANRADAAAHQLALEESRYDMLAGHIKENDRLIHDWRHHMVSLKDYASRGDLDGLNHYLDKLGVQYEPHREAPICARTAVDVILRHYISIAKDSGIEVTSHIDVPKEFGRSDVDLCVVFGNLTENAMEACKRQKGGKKYIDISTDCIGGKMLAISMENSYDGEILKIGTEFVSSKRSGIGIGLSSVKGIAEVNGGSFYANGENGVFSVEILLNT